MKKTFLKYYLTSFFCFCIGLLYAQSDALIQQYLQQGKSSGMSESDVMGLMGAKNIKTKAPKKYVKSNPRGGTDISVSIPKKEAVESSNKIKIFGSELFSQDKVSFEPNLRIATPKNYQVGAGDEILIDIFGVSESSLQLLVSPEGSIKVPYVGVIHVAGLTMEQATNRITNSLSSVYTGIKTGKISVQITLGNIRSIKVTVLGEANTPGTYTLPSLATVFNALYVSRGPNEQGTYRAIEVIRNNQIVAVVDLYEYLTKGGFKTNIRLEDQDVIRIPVYKNRIEFSGEVKRAALYEVLANESLEQMLQYAGGFTDKAYTAKIKVIQNTDKEHQLKDVEAKEYAQYQPKSADKYIVEAILDRYTNRVSIEGAIFRPGEFELEPEMTLKQLISKADGIKEDAFKNRAYIKRLKEDNLTRELLSFDLQQVLSGKKDVKLVKEDKVVIVSLKELNIAPQLTIKGEVKHPSNYDYAEGITLQDLILMAGGFQVGGSSKRIEIASRIDADVVDAKNAQISEVKIIDIDDNLGITTDKSILKPYDVVTVRVQPGYERQRMVKIEGEVFYPGEYSVQYKNERISDLIKRAGGARNMAYLEGGSLKRVFYAKEINDTENEILLRQKHIDKPGSLVEVDSVFTEGRITETPDHVADFVYVDISKVVQHPGSDMDLILEEGDIIAIPKQMQTVKIQGEVNAPSNTSFISGKGLRGYVSQAGGLLTTANINRAYVIYPNGKVKATKSFIFFNWYPKITPGSEIVVPREDLLHQFMIKDLLNMLPSLATAIGSAITIVALVKK